MASLWTWTLCFMVCIESIVAYQFTVGGKNGWAVPPESVNDTYSLWAGRNRFQIGDRLLFNYDKTKDSVLRVSKESYRSCNTSSPIASFKDGNTAFELPHDGPFYFISGNTSNCQKGEKLIVIVLAPCHQGRGKNCRQSISPVSVPSATPAPAPAILPPSPSPSPSPSPMAESPSPTILGAPSPSTPPSGNVASPASESTPTPSQSLSPSLTTPPRSSPVTSSAFSIALPSAGNLVLPLLFAALLKFA